jgi:hypothetical protein
VAEEKTDTPEITNDDVNVLRILLHDVKGLSAVSSVPDFIHEEIEE